MTWYGSSGRGGAFCVTLVRQAQVHVALPDLEGDVGDLFAQQV